MPSLVSGCMNRENRLLLSGANIDEIFYITHRGIKRLIIPNKNPECHKASFRANHSRMSGFIIHLYMASFQDF